MTILSGFTQTDRQSNLDKPDLIGFNDDPRMDELVAGYQAFLGNLSQSEDGHDSKSASSLEYEDASMIPRVGDSEMGINPSILENSDIDVWEVDLASTATTGLTQPLAQLEFNLGAESTSTQRSRSGRQTKRHKTKF